MYKYKEKEKKTEQEPLLSEMLIATSIANPEIRLQLRQYINKIKFQSNIAKDVSKLLLSTNGIPSELELEVGLSGYLKEERTRVWNYCKKFILLQDKKKIENFINKADIFYRKKRLDAIVETYSDDNTEKFIEDINSIESVKINEIPVVKFNEIDIDTVLEEEGIKDSVASFLPSMARVTPSGGFLKGQVVCVCAAPGVGKSLFLSNQLLKMLESNLKVYWIALGDMTITDFVCRLTSIRENITLNETYNSPNSEACNRTKELLNNFYLSVLPAGMIGPEDLQEIVNERIPSDIDVVIVDYDANLKAADPESLYISGEKTYNLLSQIARPSGKKYKLVIVASQPKTHFLNFEVLPKEAPNESSKKLHIMDMLITLGKNQKAESDHIGTVHYAKVRRGLEGVKARFMLTDSGIIQELAEEVYRNKIKRR